MKNVYGILILALVSMNVRADEIKTPEIRKFVDDVEQFGQFVYEYDNHERVFDEETADMILSLKKQIEPLAEICKDVKSDDCQRFKESGQRFIYKFGQLKESVEQHDHENSPEGLTETICQDAHSLLVAKSVIAHERAVAKVSGTVNKSLLNEAGNEVVNKTAELNRLEKAYKKAAKKKFDLSACNSN